MTYIDRTSAEAAIRQRTEKRCQSCREIKSLSEFYADIGRADGHEYLCIECSRIKRGVKRSRGRPVGSTIPAAEKRSTTLKTTVEPYLVEFVQQQTEHRGVNVSEYLHALIVQAMAGEEHPCPTASSTI